MSNVEQGISKEEVRQLTYLLPPWKFLVRHWIFSLRRDTEVDATDGKFATDSWS